MQPTLLSSGLFSIAEALHTRYRAGALGGKGKGSGSAGQDSVARKGGSGASDANRKLYSVSHESGASRGSQFSPAHLLATSYYLVSLLLGVIQSASPDHQESGQDDPMWNDVTTLTIACSDEVSLHVIIFCVICVLYGLLRCLFSHQLLGSESC